MGIEEQWSIVPTDNSGEMRRCLPQSVGNYTYEQTANTLTDASGRSYTWDFENHLAQLVNPGVGTTTFHYRAHFSAAP